VAENRQADEPHTRSGIRDQPEEFQRFADLTRKLAKVPKAELEKKRKAAALKHGRSAARK
jgi:hypothetical protein